MSCSSFEDQGKVLESRDCSWIFGAQDFDFPCPYIICISIYSNMTLIYNMMTFQVPSVLLHIYLHFRYVDFYLITYLLWSSWLYP